MDFATFLSRATDRHGGKFIYDADTEAAFNGSHSVIPVICPYHGRFFIEARLHLKYDCRCCSYRDRAEKSRSDTRQFVEKAMRVHGDKYDYSKVDYVKAHEKVCIVCREHGEFFMKPNYHLSGEGCPRCRDSRLERGVALYLDGIGVVYERNKRFNWLGRREVDFFIPSMKVGIECQGKQHFGLGGWVPDFDFEKVCESDAVKNSLCRLNGIRLFYVVEKKYLDRILEYPLYDRSNTFCEIEALLSYAEKSS